MPSLVTKSVLYVFFHLLYLSILAVNTLLCPEGDEQKLLELKCSTGKSILYTSK